MGWDWNQDKSSQSEFYILILRKIRVILYGVVGVETEVEVEVEKEKEK